MQSRSPVATGVLIALSVIGLLLVCWLLWQLSAVVALVLIATVLATGIDPLVERLEQWKIPPRDWSLPRGVSTLIVLLGALLVFAGILVYVGSVLWTEGTTLWNDIPDYTGAVQGWIGDLRQEYPGIPPLEDLIPQAQEQLGQVGGYVVATTAAVFGVLGGIVSLIVVLVLTFYFTHSKESIKNAFLAVMPPRHRASISETISEASQRMGGWLRGQLLLASIVVVIVSGAMWVLGMPYPLLLGLIGGVAELIPLLGPIVAGLIALPIALLTQPGWVSIVVVIFFAVFSQVESNWLAPRIMQSQVGLNPMITIVALLAGGTLGGIIGALLAVPLAAALQVVVLRHVIPSVQEAQQEGASTPEPEAEPPA